MPRNLTLPTSSDVHVAHAIAAKVDWMLLAAFISSCIPLSVYAWWTAAKAVRRAEYETGAADVEVRRIRNVALMLIVVQTTGWTAIVLFWEAAH